MRVLPSALLPLVLLGAADSAPQPQPHLPPNLPRRDHWSPRWHQQDRSHLAAGDVNALFFFRGVWHLMTQWEMEVPDTYGPLPKTLPIVGWGHSVSIWAPEFGGRNDFPPPEKNELVLFITTGCTDTVLVPFQPKQTPRGRSDSANLEPSDPIFCTQLLGPGLHRPAALPPHRPRARPRPALHHDGGLL